ncbi:MAG: NADH:flavin oxidoreductase, partial [Eubacteriales bacterium]
MSHEKFKYKSLEEIQAKAASLGITLPFAADTSILKTPLQFAGVTLPNRLGTAPMEGADALDDGSPSDFTARRYIKEAKG